MARMDFKKVESALEEGLRRMTVGKLCHLADIAAGIGNPSLQQKGVNREQQRLLRHLKTDLIRLKKKDSKVYTKLKIKKSEMDDKFSHPEKLDDDDWKFLKALRQKTKVLIDEYYPKTSDADLIKEEQERHKTRRFNINEKWLPLK